jgi:hypothetical protein
LLNIANNNYIFRISRQLKNLPPLETEIPKRRSIPKKNKTNMIDNSQKQISFDESIQGKGVNYISRMLKIYLMVANF